MKEHKSSCLTELLAWILAGVVIFIVGIFIWHIFDIVKDAFTEYTEVEFESTMAVSAAKDLIKESSTSPSSIKWTNVELIDKDQYGRYMVDVNCEGQNAFGAVVQMRAIVVLQSVDESGRYTYTPLVAVAEYHPQDILLSRDNVIELVKAVNHWGEAPEEEM